MSPFVRAKESIRHHFCRAASSYDQYAHVQAEAAVWLLALAPTEATAILEIGCGTGNLTGLLVDRFPAARITALDFAEAMVEQARAKVGEEGGVRFLCQDGEAFVRTCQERYDLVVSNATLQWFTDLAATLGHVGRLLRPEGRAVLSLFGPASFQELATAMRRIVDPEIRLPAEGFRTAAEAEEMARGVFAEVEVARRLVRREYATFFDILDHIRKTGTGGYHAKVPRLNRAMLGRLDQWFAEQGGYVITYEIFILNCRGARGKKE
jgi:malonyl-CoA O-methyltransferase